MNILSAIYILVKARQLARNGRKPEAYSLFLKSFGYHTEAPKTSITLNLLAFLP